MLRLVRLQPQVADLDRPLAVVLHEDEALVEEVHVTGAQRHLGQLGGGARRHDDQQPLLGHVDPRIAVAQRDQVEAVVGVHVADHHRVQLVGRVAAQQLGDHAGPDVQQDARAAPSTR